MAKLFTQMLWQTSLEMKGCTPISSLEEGNRRASNLGLIGDWKLSKVRPHQYPMAHFLYLTNDLNENTRSLKIWRIHGSYRAFQRHSFKSSKVPTNCTCSPAMKVKCPSGVVDHHMLASSSFECIIHHLRMVECCFSRSRLKIWFKRMWTNQKRLVIINCINRLFSIVCRSLNFEIY